MNLITSLPAWANTPEAQAFWLGLGAGAMIMLFRAAIRWFKRIDADPYGD